MNMHVWVSLSSPDSSTAARHWVLCFRKHYFTLPLKYGAKSWMVRLEKWLERKSHRFIVAY